MSPLPFRSSVVYTHVGRLGQLSPIYALNNFRTKVHVVESEALLPVIHLSHRTVSSAPAVKTVAETMAGVETHELHVFDRDDARVGYEDGLSVAR